MPIFVLNMGSSSIKCALYQSIDADSVGALLWEGGALWKNNLQEVIASFVQDGANRVNPLKVQDESEIIAFLLEQLLKGRAPILHSLEQIEGIAHRMVHGGAYFAKSVFVTPVILDRLTSLASLAPLHNPIAIKGLQAMQSFCPWAQQVVVFDTSFHRSIPEEAVVYPCPYSWYERGLHRYGFHGINYASCASRLAAVAPHAQRAVVAHLGSGASLCALKSGKSIDTTMGFTPLEGLMMNTRSGSVDPGLILHLLSSEGWSVAELNETLYHQSGLLGVSGASSDMRDILMRREKGEWRSVLAFNIYVHQLCRAIGSMVASLGGLDAIVFTGGVGEHAWQVREAVAERLAFLGVAIDLELNKIPTKEDHQISAAQASVQSWVFKAQESLEMAKQCARLLKKGTQNTKKDGGGQI